MSYQWVVDGERGPRRDREHLHPAAEGHGQARLRRGDGDPQRLPRGVGVLAGVGADAGGCDRRTTGHPWSAATRSSAGPSAPPRARWSITPDSFDYQWYAGHHAIDGATHATYVVSPAEAGHKIHVVVTAKHEGYTSLRAGSATTDRVVFGRISFAKPTLRGHAVVGRTLTARLESLQPKAAKPHYAWYRDGDPIHGAHSASYDAAGGRPRPPRARRRDDGCRQLGLADQALRGDRRRPDRRHGCTRGRRSGRAASSSG